MVEKTFEELREMNYEDMTDEEMTIYQDSGKLLSGEWWVVQKVRRERMHRDSMQLVKDDLAGNIGMAVSFGVFLLLVFIIVITMG